MQARAARMPAVKHDLQTLMGMLVIVQNKIIVPAQEIELKVSWSGPVGSAA